MINPKYNRNNEAAKYYNRLVPITDVLYHE